MQIVISSGNEFVGFFVVDKYALQQQCRWPLKHWYSAVPVYGFKKLHPLETSVEKGI